MMAGLGDAVTCTVLCVNSQPTDQHPPRSASIWPLKPPISRFLMPCSRPHQSLLISDWLKSGVTSNPRCSQSQRAVCRRAPLAIHKSQFARAKGPGSRWDVRCERRFADKRVDPVQHAAELSLSRKSLSTSISKDQISLAGHRHLCAHQKGESEDMQKFSAGDNTV